ncbi:hypothetical protein CPHO_10795 [Corynebacterium phocae]|uniref:DUF559 domain-containing protein n=1 Tax=Corynebacterium phocae TaxID=161895 RepID=A0A1L7D583_9CORY|nr:DUF559 domain-containing protein [Corynebacterium phocae]APT93298.1 hypothetical protein CPHO_10795 [Corynebacterium phocae]
MDTVSTVSGLSRSQLARKLDKGQIFRLWKGTYVEELPTPSALFLFLREKYPDALLTGRSVAQIILGEEVTFPLHFATPRRLPVSDYVSGHRTTVLPTFLLNNSPVHLPLLALQWVEDDELAISMLEKLYAGRNGRAQLEKDSTLVRLLPTRCRQLLSQAALGTDSSGEARLIRALQRKGLKVVANHKIGHYYWDAVIPRWKVAIEVDSHRHHTGLPEFIRDRWKNNDATLRGWTTLRYSGSCVAHHLDLVVEQILQAKNPDLDARCFRAVWNWHEIFLRDTSRLDMDGTIHHGDWA